MSVSAWKILAGAALLLSAAAGGWIAIKMCASRQCTRLLSLSNALAGGFFLGAALLHLLPGAQENLAVFAPPFPWAMVLCAIGFVLILFLEKVVITSHDAVAGTAVTKGKRSLVPYVLTIVLSAHSLIAGYVLGTGAAFRIVLIVFAAEFSHKLSAAFALGVSLVRSRIPTPRIFRILLAFSLMTPLGIILGVIVATRLQGETAALVSGMVDALAAGTFLYVALVDLIGEEFETSVDRWQKLGLILLGIALMGLLAIWV